MKYVVFVPLQKMLTDSRFIKWIQQPSPSIMSFILTLSLLHSDGSRCPFTTPERARCSLLFMLYLFIIYFSLTNSSTVSVLLPSLLGWLLLGAQLRQTLLLPGLPPTSLPSPRAGGGTSRSHLPHGWAARRHLPLGFEILQGEHVRLYTVNL